MKNYFELYKKDKTFRLILLIYFIMGYVFSGIIVIISGGSLGR